MASKKTSDPGSSGTLPFGAGAIDSSPKDAPAKPKDGERPQRPARRRRPPRSGEEPQAERDRPAPPAERASEEGGPARRTDGERERGEAPRERSGEDGTRSEEGERGGRRSRRWQERRRRRRKPRGGGGGDRGDGGDRQRSEARGDGQRGDGQRGDGQRGDGQRGDGQRGDGQRGDGQRGDGRAEPQTRTEHRRPDGERRRQHDQRQAPAAAAENAEGLLMIEHANHGALRKAANQWLASRDDAHVSPRLVQRYSLREGSILTGPVRRGQGRHKWDLADVLTVDGRPPNEVRSLPAFKSLTSIDPDFHYAVGDASGEVSLKVLDIICPVGRGQRGLIVAPPRSGKTILLQQFAKAIEKIYPEVHLMVLLIDERPEEATEWRRTIDKGEVFVSTNDELHKRHVELAEAVWKRCRRLVELGEDVILLLDSITRLGRAYNNVHGFSGKTMSGGIDTRALERPKQFFGSARNTETAGSLTILGTTLVETGSRMDQVIFEEFKGTGNMELVLARRLADRRIFPAIDLERSGTRKEEKLISTRRLHLINTLRRVLTKMHWAEAMELLITKLDEVEKTDDFLMRFEVDPEA